MIDQFIVRCSIVGCGMTHFLGVKIFFMAGHMFCQTEDLHLLADGSLDHIFQRVFGMAGAELAGMAVMREWHV
jgi:hypothetical protein